VGVEITRSGTIQPSFLPRHARQPMGSVICGIRGVWRKQSRTSTSSKVRMTKLRMSVAFQGISTVLSSARGKCGFQQTSIWFLSHRRVPMSSEVKVYGEGCPSGQLLELIGDKWPPIVVLYVLAGGTKRYG